MSNIIPTSSEIEELRVPHVVPGTNLAPVVAKGKFFFADGEKFFLKGVTYGPFALASHGAPFPERPMVERDFTLMRELGANTLRIFTLPPPWLLDVAAEFGLRVIVGIPWAEHVAFLDSPALSQEIHRIIADGVRACRGHSAVLACLVGNEIPPDIARWHGPERVRAFLRELVETAKASDPSRLISYANFPSTEYLDVDFTDFISFNVYLHHESAFRGYLAHLHNLAPDKPLVLTEFGIDSMREGTEFQAQALTWQLRASFDMGVAGTVIFAWTDEWFTGGAAVEDWAFGLVDRERQKKPAFHAVQQYYHAPLPPELPAYPKVSVVVCAYNAERTMAPCLASLEKLTYPNYDVIVVNDGSTDRTLEIAQRYDYVRIISQENKGLSAARNVGIAAATGEIVAFTDSDCVADPDWLTCLVSTFLRSGRAAVGGPNFPPPEDTLVPSAVAVSPGGPTHVLLDDEVAEHIPGCNMAFRKEALEEINGFDPVFRAAGDDVDLCWRLQNQGYQIGFSPAAVVWHFRRNTVKDYLNQQRGYGKAEAQLYFKHPYRFNLLGQSRWLGRIYGDLSSFFLSRRPVIYSGAFGRGLFQTMYEPPSSLIAFLPLTLEWNVAALLLFLSALLTGGYLWLGVVPLLVSLGWCLASASQARIDPRFNTWRARLLVALLAYLGPLVRSFERYRWRIRGLTEVEPIHFAETGQEPQIVWRERALCLSYWSEKGLEKENLLYGLMDFLLPRRYLIAVDQGWSDWDLAVSRGIWSRVQVKLGTENHGGLKRLLRVHCRVRMSQPARLALVGYGILGSIGAAWGISELTIPAASVGIMHLATILYQNFRLGRIVYHALEIVAKRLGLSPVDKSPTPPIRRQVFASLRPYRWMFGFAFIQVLFIGGAELLKPWPLKLIIDHVLSGQPLSWPLMRGWSREGLLLVACGGLVSIYLVLGGLNVLNNYTTIRIGQSMVNDLRAALYNHLQRLSLAFHNRRQVGDLLYRVTADTYAIQTLTMNGVFPILTSLVVLIGMTIVMLRLDWLLTLLALTVCPVLFLTISAMSSRINTAATAARERESTIYSLVQRTMGAIRVIQAFTKEEEERRRFVAASADSLAANLRLYNLQTLYAGIVNVLIALGTALVVWIGARHVLTGTLSIGELVVFTSYLAALYGPINTISQTLALIEGGKAGLRRVQEILTVERDLPEGKRVLPPGKVRGEVTFERVTFAYTSEQPVLRDVDLHVTPGQTVAVVGPTGAGKSTLVSLLPRFYDPQGGRVLLDGTDVREFTLASLRRQIAMVLQPPLVFPITLHENIAYGRPEASFEDVERAARLARIHETIMRLPQGYDTVVGEQGATLSEGERQRLTIARAILRDAPILILDEPTSSVDAETEALIMEGLDRLMAGRTAFIIAHRLSTVRGADVIVVVRDGQIVEQGSFTELVRRQGPFAALYHTQFSNQEEPRRAIS